MVCSLFFFICSYRTGIALRRNHRHHQRDSDRVHHQRASSWGLASGSQDSCTGFWRWHMLTFHTMSASLWFSLILSVFDNWIFPLRMLYISINNDITLVSHCNKSLLHCSFKTSQSNDWAGSRQGFIPSGCYCKMAVCSVWLVPFRADTLSLMSCSYSLIFFFPPFFLMMTLGPAALFLFALVQKCI